MENSFMSRVKRVDVSTLRLDPENPRLPEEVQNASPEVILDYLEANFVLDELVASFITNGYFEGEPMVVSPANGDGIRTVWEGNRRLAALMILHQLPPAREAGIEPMMVITKQDRAKLSSIPVVEAKSVEAIATYLGFRHISGPKMWGPEAKARWIHRLVNDIANDHPEIDPFKEAGRIAGSNARGVRSSYFAFEILRYAREELDIPSELVSYVLKERFGVWQRLLGTANVLPFIGINGLPQSYAEVLRATAKITQDDMKQVLSDLTPSPTQRRKAILEDSRDVTAYSDVLVNPKAREAMWKYDSLSLATQIVATASLADRLKSLRETTEVLLTDISRYEVTQESVVESEQLFGLVRSLRGAIAAAVSEEDE